MVKIIKKTKFLHLFLERENNTKNRPLEISGHQKQKY